eukprot:2412963-Ditylum_brightwellii.AAC.1
MDNVAGNYIGMFCDNTSAINLHTNLGHPSLSQQHVSFASLASKCTVLEHPSSHLSVFQAKKEMTDVSSCAFKEG